MKVPEVYERGLFPDNGKTKYEGFKVEECLFVPFPYSSIIYCLNSLLMAQLFDWEVFG